jgi:hypothetical protein
MRQLPSVFVSVQFSPYLEERVLNATIQSLPGLLIRAFTFE